MGRFFCFRSRLEIKLVNELVSVIIPAHNRSDFVDEAARSVYHQTYRPIELIIVDDLSDKLYTPKIFSEPGFEIKVIRHEENKGPGASRETGRLAAHGDYIAYLDSDDLWHPEKLEKQVAMLRAHYDMGMCYSQTILFSKMPLTDDEPYRKNSDVKFTDFLPVVLNVRPWCTSSCLWTRGAVERIGPWFDGWHYEDVEYDVRAGCRDIKIAYLPEPLCYYRLSCDGSGLSNSANKFSVGQQARSLLQIGKNLKQFNKIKDEQIQFFFIKRMFKTAFEAINYGDRKSAIKLFWNMIGSSSDIKNKVIVFLFLCSCLAFPTRVMDSIKYRIKRYIF